MGISVLDKRDQLNVTDRGLYIDGTWTDEAAGRFDHLHPATNEVVTSVAEAGADAVGLAVQAARRAFDDGPWGAMRPRQRKRYLQKFADLLEARADELAMLQTLDNGLPIHHARNSRISAPHVADVFDYFAGWADKVSGETPPLYTDAHDLQFVTFREPVGVAAGIIPWNGPMMMFAYKVAPALACGCTVVLKPSENASLCALRLTELMQDLDLPPGVFNLVTGGPETGQALVDHPGVDKVAFTGSQAVGAHIASTAGADMKRVTLELGGKSAALVFPDVPSPEQAGFGLMAGASTFLSGQICSLTTRVLVHASIYDRFLDGASAQLETVRLGDPYDPETTSAALINRRQKEKVLGYMDIGLEGGARLVAGGGAPGGDLKAGNWVNPTLFADVDNASRLAQEEIFGPVLSVIPFKSEGEAIEIANASRFGLSGAIFTRDVARAFRVGRQMKTGSVGVNGYGLAPNAPIGGVKASGIGREGGQASIEAYTELKTMIFNLAG